MININEIKGLAHIAEQYFKLVEEEKYADAVPIGCVLEHALYILHFKIAHSVDELVCEVREEALKS